MAALYLLICISLIIALRGVLGKQRFFEYPTLVALVFLAFFVPQALAAERSSMLRNYDPWILWMYMSLCLLTILGGFALGKRLANRYAAQHMPAPVRKQGVVMGCVILAMLGLYSTFRVQTMADASDLGNAWTGEITLWYLLMQTTFFSFALACLGYVKADRNKILIIVGAVMLMVILVMVSNNVKRHMIAEVGIIVAGSWFFIRHKQPPKVLLLIGCFLGTVLLHQVGTIREYVRAGQGTSIDAIVNGVPFQDFRYFNHDDAPEISQAIITIYAVNQSGKFEGPASLWNMMVHQYVPAFIVGQKVKDSLRLESNLDTSQDYRLVKLYRAGATHTGFADTYLSYWVFGAAIFFMIGMFMGWLYGMAYNGRLWAQFYYLVLLNDGLVATTESTDRFFVSLPVTFGLTLWFVLPRLGRLMKGRSNAYRSAPFRARRRSSVYAN